MKTILAIIALPLASCSGYSIRPSFSFEDGSGHVYSASVTITPTSGKSPRNVTRNSK
jgi:hypothetical protein